MLNGLSGFSTERWWPDHALLQATSIPAVKMWNAKCEVCSTECHVAIPVQVRDLPVDKHRLRTSWEARQGHRALQSATGHWRGRSDERLMADSTLSADGTSGTATLQPANRGVQCWTAQGGHNTECGWTSQAPITMISMSTWRETEHELVKGAEGADTQEPRIGLDMCGNRQHLSWGGENLTSNADKLRWMEELMLDH